MQHLRSFYHFKALKETSKALVLGKQIRNAEMLKRKTGTLEVG